MNLESRIFENIEAEEAYKKAKEMLDEAAIKPEEFKGKDGYNDEEVERDKAKAEELKNKYEKRETSEQKEAHKLATIFEAIIHENAELSDWFGSNAFTVKPSDFDDFENGVDTVVEFLGEEEETATHLALGIDVTFSSDTHEKFDRIKNEIENGELAHVKYFVSENSPHRRLENIPRVVIGASADTVKKLREIWVEEEKGKMSQHPIQFQILEEISMQLEAFKKYALSIGRTEMAEIYEKEKLLISKIYSDKKELIKGNEERDDVFYAIKENVKSRFTVPSTAEIE